MISLTYSCLVASLKITVIDFFRVILKSAHFDYSDHKTYRDKTQINHTRLFCISHCRVTKSCGGPVEYLGSVRIHMQLKCKKESDNKCP